jgi:hypothetical protein
MTRTDFMASSRPRTSATAAAGRSKACSRALLALSAVLLLAFALAAPGVAAAAGESTSGYNQTPVAPQSSTTPVSPQSGTSPSKETSTPATGKEEPAKASSTTSSAKASTLPFTGFDLRWSLAVGLVLICAGFSIVAVQRRQHRGRSR